MVFHHSPTNHIIGKLGGGGRGGSGLSLWKNDFELRVRGEGQDPSFEGGFGSMRTILPM